MVTDISRKIREDRSFGLLDIKRDVTGSVVFQTINSGTATTTTTVTTTTGAQLLATKIVAVGQGATPTWTGTIKRNGVTLTSGTGVTTLSTSNVLDAPADAPNTITISITLANATTVSWTASRASRVG